MPDARYQRVLNLLSQDVGSDKDGQGMVIRILKLAQNKIISLCTCNILAFPHHYLEIHKLDIFKET